MYGPFQILEWYYSFMRNILAFKKFDVRGFLMFDV